MRVAPPVLVTSIAARVWMTAALSDGLICAHVVPPSVERQIPRAYELAYRTFEFAGSSSMSRTPRGEQTPVLLNSAIDPVQSSGLADPLWTKLHVAPPFVVLYMPHLAMPGTGLVTPEQQTDERPRRAVVVPTHIVFESPGLTTIEPMPLPVNSALPILVHDW